MGDPRQLPATILSKQNQRLAFDRSLFQRLMDAGWPVRMLSVQYRMHPHIRRFPGKHFYDDELKVRTCMCTTHVRSGIRRAMLTVAVATHCYVLRIADCESVLCRTGTA